MKNKIIAIAIIVLIVILVGVWLYPAGDSEDKESGELTGAGISTEPEEVETQEEPEVEETAEVEEYVEEDKELDEIRGRALIGKCLLECSSGETDLENDLWKSMCNKKYNQGEDVIREFIRTC